MFALQVFALSILLFVQIFNIVFDLSTLYSFYIFFCSCNYVNFPNVGFDEGLPFLLRPSSLNSERNQFFRALGGYWSGKTNSYKKNIARFLVDIYSKLLLTRPDV